MEPQGESKGARHPPQPQEPSIGCQTRVFSGVLTLAAFLFLTANTAAAVYRCRHQPSALAFVAFCYCDLILLFLCLKSFERLGPDGQPEKKTGLKAATWLLATALNLAFSWRVAVVMPPAIAGLVWVMAGSVAVGGFYFLFLHREDKDNELGHGYRAVEGKELSAEEKV